MTPLRTEAQNQILKKADVFAFAPVRLDVHHILDAVATAQLIAGQRGEHVAISECRLWRATLAKVPVDDRAQPTAIKLPENLKKSTVRVDVVGF